MCCKLVSSYELTQQYSVVEPSAPSPIVASQLSLTCNTNQPGTLATDATAHISISTVLPEDTLHPRQLNAPCNQDTPSCLHLNTELFRTLSHTSPPACSARRSSHPRKKRLHHSMFVLQQRQHFRPSTVQLLQAGADVFLKAGADIFLKDATPNPAS